MGFITVHLPDHLEKKLIECGAHVDTILERAVRHKLEETTRHSGSSADSQTWEYLER